MKKIKIAHLYYDLMNLYGENGNIIALKNILEKHNIKCDISYLTVNDEINFNKYDLFYIGCGTDNNQEIVRKDIIKYKKDIKKNIEKKVFIATGNSFELFGKSINNLEALNIFDFESKYVEKRIVGECNYTTKLIKYPVIGFQNRGSENNITKNFLFKIKNGFGNNLNSKYEGYHEYNFYGTYTIGPLLIRNPFLLKKIIKELFNNLKIPYKDINLDYEEKAYNEYLKNFNIK